MEYMDLLPFSRARLARPITNYKPSPKYTTATDTNLPDRLKDFYSRFDTEHYFSFLYHSLLIPPSFHS